MYQKYLRFVLYVNTGILVVFILYFFIFPAILLIHDLGDPGLQNGQIPGFAFRWHRSLSPKYARWAQERIASGTATDLDLDNVSGTEWPLFGSVFYLWATESLQEAWEEDHSRAPVAPKIYAQEAIKASAALLADPNHAVWVKKYWGDKYLTHENLFYRMLLINGLTSYQKLLGDRRYQVLLAEQVESLAREIDASPYGLLDDYPGQCFPVDIVPAIAAIGRADAVLGTDHSAFIKRALRAFTGKHLDRDTGLPPYNADAMTGLPLSPARGTGVSYMLLWAPEMWPEESRKWYQNYERLFYQQKLGLVGFREFSKKIDRSPWLTEVDSGPVIWGFSTSGSTFGLGAARVNGRLDHAYAIGAEVLAAGWQLPDGTLLSARALSNFSDAPYIGEAAIIFNYTRQPVFEPSRGRNLKIPGIVYLIIAGLFLWGVGRVTIAIIRSRRLHREWSQLIIPRARVQFYIWLLLISSGTAITILTTKVLIGILLILAAQLLPMLKLPAGSQPIQAS